MKYRVTVNTLTVAEADTLAEAVKVLRGAVRLWRAGQLFPRQRGRSGFTAVRWDKAQGKNTGAWTSLWEFKDHGNFNGYARIVKGTN